MNRLLTYLCIGILVQYILAVVLIQIFPAETAKEKGIRLEHRYKYRDAILAYTNAIEEDESDAESFYLRGRCNSLLNLNDQALADINHAIELDTKNPLAYLELAEHYFRRKMIPEAEENLSIVFEMDSEIADAYFLRAQLNYGKAKLHYYHIIKYDLSKRVHFIDQAIQDYDKVISYKPFDLNSHRFKADMYISKKDFDQAIKIYSYILDNPEPFHIKNDNSILLSLARIYKEKGDLKTAIQLLEEEVQSNPQVFTAKRLTEYYEENGQTEKAKETKEYMYSLIE